MNTREIVASTVPEEESAKDETKPSSEKYQPQTRKEKEIVVKNIRKRISENGRKNVGSTGRPRRISENVEKTQEAS